MKNIAFPRPKAMMRIERHRSTFAQPSCCQKSHSIDFQQRQSSPLLRARCAARTRARLGARRPSGRLPRARRWVAGGATPLPVRSAAWRGAPATARGTRGWGGFQAQEPGLMPVGTRERSRPARERVRDAIATRRRRKQCGCSALLSANAAGEGDCRARTARGVLASRYSSTEAAYCAAARCDTAPARLG
jgi:hypothetical protein